MVQRLVCFFGVLAGAVNGVLIQEDEHQNDVAFLQQTGFVEGLAADPDMVTKLELLQQVMGHERLSLLQVPETPAGGVKKITSLAEANKELAPVFEKMKSLDPKGAQMLQSIMQMVSAFGKGAKHAPVARASKQESFQTGTPATPPSNKKAFMQVRSSSDHFGNTKTDSGVDPAVMEERLMRIQPILLKLKQMNGHLFGGLANVVQKAERHAEDEVVNGSLK